MKKFAKIALVVLMLATCIFAVVACDKNEQTKTTISISADNMPQTVFVKGNDLDLSKGKLTVVSKATTEVALNAEGVAVTGYDKNTVGKQTLTISYSGASTTLDVTVVERMVADNNVVKTYFVGEELDTAGSLKITKDDGTSVNVNLSDSKLAFSGFNSSEAGIKTVNVVYTDGELQLSGSFSVVVYVPDVKFTAPSKRAYNSHDTEIDTTGGYFALSANGGTPKYVNITQDMIKTEIDPTIVSEDNQTATQIIKIEYIGKEYNYNITVKLSDVTRIKNISQTLSALDWSGDKACEVSKAQGELALKALNLYYGLSINDVECISEEEIMTVVRPAAVYANGIWETQVAQYNELFKASYNSLTINCVNLEATRTQFAAFNALDKTESELYVFGTLLSDTIASFGQSTMFGKTTVSGYLNKVCSGATFDEALKKIDLMLQMHDALKDIPKDWKLEDLTSTANAEKIEAAQALAVQLGELAQPIFERYLFSILSVWRDSDYFDILYRYYFSLYQSEDKTVSNKGWTGMNDMVDICWPGVIEVYYQRYIDILLEQFDLQFTNTEEKFVPANEIDTIYVVTYIRQIMKLYDEIAAIDDEMISTLFAGYNLSKIITNLQTGDYGLFDIFGSAVEVPEFEELWTKYIDTISSIGEDIKLSGDKIEDMFATFIALTPELQSQFLCSLNAYGSAELSPSDGTGRSTMFFELLIAYYGQILPRNLIFLDEAGNEGGILLELFDALQDYILRNEVASEEQPDLYFKEFLSKMKSVETMYGALNASDKKAFDEHVGFFYERYLGIYKLYDKDGKFIEKEIKEWQDEIDSLEQMYEVLSSLLMTALKDYTKYPLFISTYEATVELYDAIMAEAPEEVKNMLLYANSDVFDDMEASLETFKYQYRMFYIYMLSEYPVDSQTAMMAWNMYQESNMSKYMSSLFGFYTCAYVGDGMTLEIVKQAMEGYRALTDTEKYLFYNMDGEGQYMYFKALRSFFADAFKDGSERVELLVNDLLDLELNLNAGMTEAEFIDAWELLAKDYTALAATDKELFDTNLKEMYDYYKAMYDEVMAEKENA